MRAVELAATSATIEPVDLDTLRDEADGLAASEEELLLLALFGEEAEPLLRAIRERSGGDESLAARGVDQERAERIREVVRIVQETGVGEITIEEDGMRVSVRRTAEPRLRRGAAAPAVRTATRELPPVAPRDDSLVRVESPMVGTFYRAPAPGARARSSRRATRSRRADALHPRGDEADERGEGRGRGESSAAIHVGNAEPVEYGQLLFELEPINGRPLDALMFSRVLVANRGEIAVRVIRALHELGVEAVAVYSTADRDALHVRMADQAVCVGPPSAAESYLRIPSVIAAAETTGCQAVHPGYGFLAENPAFVEACVDNDLVFVGPPADVMATMGDKIAAKQAMRAADVPTVPGAEGATTSSEARAGGRRDRLPDPAQGDGGRRRQGHAPRARGRTSSRTRSARPRPRRRPRSATRRCTSRRRSSRRATSRSRCSATSTATCSRSASASARSSAATRS